jgi:nucleotide-binding universal stress UspA family protein
MKVLLATEGSKFSEAAIEKCCRMFEEAEDAEIRVLTVIEPATGGEEVPVASSIGEVDAASRTAAEKTAGAANARILERLPSIGGGLTSSIAVGKPAQVIVDEAERWGADLIVVGAHGAGFWDRALIGSVSNAVVQHAKCSVLVVRPRGEGNTTS